MIGPTPMCTYCKHKTFDWKCTYYGRIPKLIMAGDTCKYFSEKPGMKEINEEME